MIDNRLQYRGRVLLISMVITGLSACANVGETPYERPSVPAKQEWSGDDSKPTAAEVIRRDWWKEFNDEYLNKLIERAIKGDIDLRVLAARIDVARADAKLERAESLPKVNLDLSKTITRSSEQSGTTHSYSAQTGSSWEVDVWGRVSQGISAKISEYRATEADWRAGYLTLVSDVANRYFEIRKLDQQLEYQQNSINMNRKIQGIYNNQYREGLVAESRLLQQQAEFNDLRKDQLEQQRQRTVAENNLATLLGIPAGELHVPVSARAAGISIPKVPVGLPSDLLSRRPDIVAQEQRVLAAHQLLGQARLAKLPRFSLTGTGSFTSNILSALLKNWSLGLVPAISIPIFDPSIKANIKSNEASARVAEEEYRNTVMQAFEEVETALVNISFRKKQQEQVTLQLSYLEQVNRNIHAQLEEGMVSQLQVFESERSILSAQLGQLELMQQVLVDTVTLYKTLGGGWNNQDLMVMAHAKDN
ncbi:MAG: efflux transporter outer membrane subunit [Amphritea sp.]